MVKRAMDSLQISTIGSLQFLKNRFNQVFLGWDLALKANFSIDGDGGKGSGSKCFKHIDSLSIPQTPLMVIDPIFYLFWKVGYCCQHVDAGSSLRKIGDEYIHSNFFHLVPSRNDTTDDRISEFL